MNEKIELENLILTMVHRIRVLEMRLERLEDRYESHLIDLESHCDADSPPDSRG